MIPFLIAGHIIIYVEIKIFTRRIFLPISHLLSLMKILRQLFFCPLLINDCIQYSLYHSGEINFIQYEIFVQQKNSSTADS